MIMKERKWNCCKSIIAGNNWFLQKVFYDIENALSRRGVFSMADNMWEKYRTEREKNLSKGPKHGKQATNA